MADQLPETSLQIRTLVTPEGKLELSLEKAPVKAPGPDQVLVRVEGTPINPSDLGLLVGGADMSTAVQGGTKDSPTVSADVPEGGLRAMKARLGQSLAVGNEGAGTVIAAGDSPAAQALLGKMVTCLGGNMYQQYRTLHVSQCMALPDGTTAEQGASCYVNPLTALSFVETMKAKGHEALVHTAAASNLGQMLNKICLKDGVPILNIVRKEEQAEILRGIGLLRVARDLDLAEEIAGPPAPMDRTHRLVAGGLGLGMDNLRHEFAGDACSANRHPAEFEMRALGEPYLDFDAGVIAARIGNEERGTRAFAKGDTHPVHFGRIAADDHAAGHALASGDVDRLPLVKRRHAQPRDRVHIGITPCFVAAGGEGQGSGLSHHAITES